MFTEAHIDTSSHDTNNTSSSKSGLGLLNAAIARAQEKLLSLQSPEGYWVFELEADCTIPSEYIMMMHYLDDIDEELQRKMAVYLRSRQAEDGSYPLFTGGPGDISGSVKAYYALKMAGDAIDAPHMVKLREWILSQGGAARANVFTESHWRYSNNYPGAACRIFRWKLCCCPAGFRFIWTKYPIGRAP